MTNLIHNSCFGFRNSFSGECYAEKKGADNTA